jgi:hypothetical protein
MQPELPHQKHSSILSAKEARFIPNKMLKKPNIHQSGGDKQQQQQQQSVTLSRYL